MKKHIFSIAIFLLCLFFCPMLSHAQGFMPPVLPQLAPVPEFLMNVAQMQILSNYDLNVRNTTDINRINQIVNGRSVQDSISCQYVDNANVPELQAFYDSNGNIVIQQNTYTVFGTSDIGDFSCVVSKETGEILFSYNEYDEVNSTLAAGLGLQYTASFDNFVQAFDNAKDTLIVYGNQVTEEEIEKLERYDYYCLYHSDYYDFTMFAPNCCSDQCLVTFSSHSASGYVGQLKYEIHQQEGNAYAHYRLAVYAMDPSLVYFSGNSSFGLTYYPYSQWNQRWSYVNNWPTSQAMFLQGGIIDCRLPSSYQEYSANMTHTNNVVYLIPGENTGENTDVYNYTEVTNNYRTPTTNINNNYDYSNPVNYYNYPVNNEVSYPDYSSTVNNYYETVNNYINRPQIDTDQGGELDSSQLTNNIPILTNLRRRFPFSIPWDIQAIFKGLVAEREAPNFHWSVYIAPIDYTWAVDIDLSQFDSTAALFRTLFLISFIIGLAVFAYNHYFGS